MGQWDLLSRTDVVDVAVRSYMKSLMGGWLLPHFSTGPLHCTSTGFAKQMFMVNVNRITKMVQAVISPSQAYAIPVFGPSRDVETAPTVVVQDE